MLRLYLKLQTTFFNTCTKTITLFTAYRATLQTAFTAISNNRETMDLRTRLNSHVRQHSVGGNYFYFKLWFCDSITCENN
jgi:hypothetical protein